MNLWTEAVYRRNQLNVFLDRCLSTYLVGFVEASVQSDSECMSHTLYHHFCTHALPSGNCVSDLPIKVGVELESLMSSASNSFFFLVCFCFWIFKRKKLRVSSKKKKGWSGGNHKPNSFSFYLMALVSPSSHVQLHNGNVINYCITLSLLSSLS